MPTGYTTQLMDRNYNLRDWMMNDLIRGMGISIMLRDDGQLSDGEIETRLALAMSEAESQVTKAEAALAQAQEEITMLTPEQWKAQHAQCVLTATIENDQRRADHEKHRAAHLLTLEKLRDLLTKVSTDVSVGLITFAIDQITIGIDFDYSSGPYQSPMSVCLDTYIADESIDRIAYAKSTHQHSVEFLTRAQERLAAFRALSREIEVLLPSEVTKP